MPSTTLIDAATDPGTERRRIEGPGGGSVALRTLRGGRRDGVDLVDLDNGALAVAIVPTRGMGIWKGRYQGDPIGWRSPIEDGPVHPKFVDLGADGGIGWLGGFDELMVRCGLESHGAPYAIEGPRPTVVTLHGRIANIPAHFVAVHVDDAPPHAITLEGRVDEARLFGPRTRLTTRTTTVPGSNRLVVRDEFRNLKDTPADFQLLYHWNFGPPYLEEGSRFVAPIQLLVPRDARAAEGIGHVGVYGPPEPGFAEQAYYLELLGDGPEGRTLVMLRNRAGDKAVVLRFRKAELPAFTLWKCTGGLADGYVTGLEPATNYPNPKPFERARGRVSSLAPGGSRVAETILEVLDSREAVERVEAEIQALQSQARPDIREAPTEPFAPEV